MTRPGDERPSWMGAPGYQPHPELPPHSPMPGAPPYPAHEEHPPPPVGERAKRTSWPRVLGATAVWAAVNLVLLLVVSGAPPSPDALGRTVGGFLVATGLASLLTWVAVRRQHWRFWVLVLAAAPLYWVLRAVTNLPGVGS